MVAGASLRGGSTGCALRDALHCVPMRKTSVYLAEQQAERLARLAREEGRSQAEVLREAIDSYQPRGIDDRNFALDGCVAGSGDSIADFEEEQLLRGFGE